MATRRRLTENFNIEEFDCNDGTKVPQEYIPQLVVLCMNYLEPLRKKFGPCQVLSGYRHVEYNRRIGGARESYHVYTLRRPRDGVAADVRFAKGTPKQWRRRARWLRMTKRKGQGGIGYYPEGNFVHIDTRDYKANWNGS